MSEDGGFSETLREAAELHRLVHASAVTDRTPLPVGAKDMDLPEPRTKLAPKEKIEVTSESGDKNYTISQCVHLESLRDLGGVCGKLTLLPRSVGLAASTGMPTRARACRGR